MASGAAHDAIRNWLEANFTAATLYFENEDATPPDAGLDVRWVYVEIEGDEEDQASIGGGSADENIWRETGTIKAYVIVPVGEGVGAGNDLRDQLADALRGLQTGGVVCRRMSRVAGLSWEGNGNGNWWALPLVVEFYRDA